MNVKEALRYVKWVVDDSGGAYQPGKNGYGHPHYSSILVGWEVDSQPFFVAAHSCIQDTGGLPLQIEPDKAVSLARDWLTERNQADPGEPNYVLALIPPKDIYQLISHQGGTMASAIGWALKLDRTCQSEAYDTLALFNKVWSFLGIKEISYSSRLTSNAGISYCNAGDAYALTLAYDWRTEAFQVGCWADWQEKAQTQMLAEAWEDWIRTDFENQLKLSLQLIELEYDDDQAIKALFDKACQQVDSYPIAESSGVVCEVNEIATTVALDDLRAHKIRFEAIENEQRLENARVPCVD
ncbi:MAG: hypothetical protein QNJ46_07995 [Leptolyngbyaceae cyanobacterium MO_188.B28]|nr:hypothetical protein [Leptolyngbyaceae cyanobacterium MO_188.B28]